MTRRERDRIASVVWLAVGLAICVGAYRLSLGSLRQPGPGFFSFLAGLTLSVLSCVLFAGSRKGQPGEEGGGPWKALWPDRRRVRRMVVVVVLLICYTVGMNVIGFGLSSLLFLGIVLRMVDPQPWRRVVICSILGSFGSWFVFKYWLEVQLPGGFIGY